ncbi:RHS repeat domain-containing protein [Capnocytophaga canimorsus]|uniref:RHS repeat domain-containing protein n=1 Tax=Capnocytophaga canimorsus TaxID=28188 RepID=UPI001EE05329|nr:RHS repeat domain-containing protein [Capnocytophaga canimorsus]GJQ03994.1 hypothetical protein CAPN009_04090 [Capnocytophaga canimorsus]
MKIKSVKEMFYKGIENQGKVEKGEYTGSQERLYNEQGNLLKETYYYPDGTVEEMKDRLYDAHGRLIEENIYGGNVYYYTGNDGITHHKATYLYDAHGNLIEECRYFYSEECIDGKTIYNKDKFTKSIYIYDTKGNLLIDYRKSTYNSEEKLTEKHIYTYDDKGNEIQSVWYWKEELSSIANYLYDEQENLLECKLQNSDGEISIFSYSYAYNPDTQLTEITAFSNGDKSKVTYKDAEGNEVLSYRFSLYQEPKGAISERKITKKDFEEYCTYKGNGNLSRRWIEVYDDKGFCIEDKCFDYDEYTIKESDEIPEGDLKESDVCQNTYDENGNLIHQIRYIEYFYEEPSKEIIITEFIREYY